MSKTLISGFLAAVFAAGLVSSAAAQMAPNPGDQVDRHNQVDLRGAPTGDMRDQRGADPNWRDHQDRGWRDRQDGGWRHHHRRQICRWRYHHRACYWR